MYSSCSFFVLIPSGMAGTFRHLTYLARSGRARKVRRRSFSRVPYLAPLNFFLMCSIESVPLSCISSYSTLLAAPHHFLQLSPKFKRSLIQHVEQLRLPTSRCDFFNSPSTTSSISSGSFLNPSPGVLGVYFKPKFVGLVGLGGPRANFCGVISVACTCCRPCTPVPYLAYAGKGTGCSTKERLTFPKGLGTWARDARKSFFAFAE